MKRIAMRAVFSGACAALALPAGLAIADDTSDLKAEIAAQRALALYAVSSAWFTYNNASDTATVVQDRLLLGSARMIAEQVRSDDGVLQAIIPPAALELSDASGPRHQ